MESSGVSSSWSSAYKADKCGGSCQIDVAQRRYCSTCRFEKCLNAGMRSENIFSFSTTDSNCGTFSGKYLNNAQPISDGSPPVSDQSSNLEPQNLVVCKHEASTSDRLPLSISDSGTSSSSLDTLSTPTAVCGNLSLLANNGNDDSSRAAAVALLYAILLYSPNATSKDVVEMLQWLGEASR